MTDPTPLAWPTDLGYGTLTGRFVYLDGDSDDPGDEPDLIPAAGGTVTVRSNAPLSAYLGSSPLTAVAREVTGIVDAQGYLCRRTASGLPGPRGLSLVATDSDKLSTEGFNYAVTVKIPGATIPTMHVSVPAGQTKDITTAVTESVSAGTKVVTLTPEIRAEIETAVASVTPTLPDDLVTAAELDQAIAGVEVDTSGLATTERVAQVEASIPEVVLRESALLDGETITSTRLETVEKADGSTVLLLVQTTNTGREVTAEVPSGLAQGAATYDSGFVDVSGWEERGGVNAASAWLRRVGNRVTCVLYGADITSGSALIIPRDGYKIASYQDSWGDTRARGIRRHAEGTSTRPVFNAVAGGAFWPETVEGTNSAEVVLEWFTDDPAPTGS